MKTYKSGISLIVLVITVIVLAILATTVIVSLSETNIITKTNQAVFKSDMANYKEMYQLYLTEQLLENSRFNSYNLNLTADDDQFTEIFGNNVKDEYLQNLFILNGKLVYCSSDTSEQQVLQSLDMLQLTMPLSNIKIGDLVAYTPTANPRGSYEGVTYDFDYETATRVEVKENYTPGEMKWVYLGKDENGNILLTSQETTSFEMFAGGAIAWKNCVNRIDTLCNTLYGNSEYGVGRNMKIEDVNRVLGYNGPLGSYYIDGELIMTDEAMTFGEIATVEGVTLVEAEYHPGLTFEDYLADDYSYTGTTYKADTTDEYNVIFKNLDGTINYNGYLLSSLCAEMYLTDDSTEASFYVRMVHNGKIAHSMYIYDPGGDEGEASGNLRPVIVLNSNIQFGAKNADGELTLVKI